MTVMTVSTVGFGDIAPETASDRLFTVVLIITGVGAVLALVSVIASPGRVLPAAACHAAKRRLCFSLLRSSSHGSPKIVIEYELSIAAESSRPRERFGPSSEKTSTAKPTLSTRTFQRIATPALEKLASSASRGLAPRSLAR
jgi:hypothetical protein